MAQIVYYGYASLRQDQITNFCVPTGGGTPVSVSITSSTNVSCNGGSDGSVTVVAHNLGKGAVRALKRTVGRGAQVVQIPASSDVLDRAVSAGILAGHQGHAGGRADLAGICS